jgi:hypothetical protein
VAVGELAGSEQTFVSFKDLSEKLERCPLRRREGAECRAPIRAAQAGALHLTD